MSKTKKPGKVAADYVGQYFTLKNPDGDFYYWNGPIKVRFNPSLLRPRFHNNSVKVDGYSGKVNIKIEFTLIKNNGRLGSPTTYGRLPLGEFNKIFRPATPKEVAKLRPKTNLLSIAEGLIAGKPVNTKRRGGKRPNAGRKAKEDAKVTISFRVPASKEDYFKTWIYAFITGAAYITTRRVRSN